MQKNIKVPTYFSDKVEKMLKEKDAQLKKQAEKDARHFAEVGRPLHTRDRISHYIGTFKSGYEELISATRQQLQTDAHFPEMRIDEARTREVISRHSAKIVKNETSIRNHKIELDKIPVVNILAQFRSVIIASLIIFGGEAIFNTMAFQILGDSKVFSLLLAACVGIIIGTIAHHGAKKLLEAQDLRQKIRICVALAVVILPSFFAMAYLRDKYMHTTGAIDIQPWVFVVINGILFISTVILFMKLPTKEEIATYYRARKIEGNIRKLEKENRSLEKEIKSLEDELAELEKQRNRIVLYSENTVQRIVKLYEECYSLFITTNIKIRSDNQTPDCFAAEAPPLNTGKPITFTQTKK